MGFSRNLPLNKVEGPLIVQSGEKFGYAESPSKIRIRVLIIDGERAARERVRKMLQDDPDVDVIGECSDGVDGLTAIREAKPDLIILDINIPGIDGFSLLDTLPRDQRPGVIFVTSYDRYALRAFEVSALDYLLKPFGADRLQKALRRAKNHIKVNSTPAEKKDVQRLAIRTGKRVFFLKAEEIDWIEAEGNSVRLHSGKEAHMLRTSISSLESELDQDKFVRIHRSTIVNVDRIRWLEPSLHGNYRVILMDGTQLVLSRRDKLPQMTGKTIRNAKAEDS